MITKIKKIQPAIHHMLSAYPETRDSDELLMIKIWEKESTYFNTIFQTSDQFATALIQGKHSNPETIRRSRQKIQQKNPKLRGKAYAKRHKLAKDVKKEINSV